LSGAWLRRTEKWVAASSSSVDVVADALGLLPAPAPKARTATTPAAATASESPTFAWKSLVI
jgi:hypothetical protein